MTTRLLVLFLLALLLAACGGAAMPSTQEPVEVTVVVTAEGGGETEVIVVTATPEPNFRPTRTPIRPLPTPAATQPPVTPVATPIVEERVVELEWPPEMRLGDSDLLRLSLVPQGEGYVVEFEGHEIITDTVAAQQREGYDLVALARLDAVTFTHSPDGEQRRYVIPGEEITWRWTLTPQSAGQHRLSIYLALQWIPLGESTLPPREAEIFSRGLTVQVISFMGLTRSQATLAGVMALLFGSTLSLPLAAYVLRPRRAGSVVVAPNNALLIEMPPGYELSAGETALLRALFRAYARLTVKAEFRSGYSGARIFLALPIRPDGRADAHTIAKLGERESIEKEFENYETFVKHTLPPMTARIQNIPVALPGSSLAALRYTFIGEPGQMPLSLRQTLLRDPDPAWLEKLFRTFGPSWWMQRRPYTFRLGQEYDRMLPSHYVLEPTNERESAGVLDGRLPPAQQPLAVGDVVTLRNLHVVERQREQYSLVGQSAAGQPPLRVRWQAWGGPSNGQRGRVVATRESLLRDIVSGFERFGLPDPLERLPALLDGVVTGTSSTIHGDLNLENVLIGLGDLVWLIDFAMTRDGHPLADFAHLEAELIAHVLAPRLADPKAFLALLRAESDPLLTTLHTIAARCLFDPDDPREYHLALFVACLGALKFKNLDSHQKHLLYLAAAHTVTRL